MFGKNKEGKGCSECDKRAFCSMIPMFEREAGDYKSCELYRMLHVDGANPRITKINERFDRKRKRRRNLSLDSLNREKELL